MTEPRDQTPWGFPDLGPPDAVPRLVCDVSVGRMSLQPREMYVITRVDGQTRLDDICSSTGLGEEATVAILRRLVDMGVVVMPAPAAAPARPAAAPAPAPTGGDDACDLDADQRRMIDSFFARLAEMDMFELVGAEPGADRAAVRRAFTDQARRFHPDRYFGRKLGAYAQRLARIFGQVSSAYEFLQDDARRAEYEPVARRARGLGDADRRLRDEEKRALDELASLGGPPPAPESRRAPPGGAAKPPPQPPARPAHPSRLRAFEPRRERREADPARDQRILKERVEESQRRRQRLYPKLARRRWRARSREFHQIAVERLRAGDAQGALSSAQLALVFGARSREVSDLVSELKSRVAEDRASHYARRAEFEELGGRPETAALLWERAAEARPRALYHRRAAEAFLGAGELPAATEHGIRATEFEPESARARFVLARAYAAARRDVDARREADLALRLDPSLDGAREFLRELGPGK